MNTIDLELSRAEVEVKQLEARLRVVPMNDNQLLQALERALAQKRERLENLRARHATGK
jgi:hypothetical protein